MKNYINKNINTSIKWSKKDKKIIGLNIFDKKQIIGRYSPTGYCGSIELTAIGQNLQIWTNGKYQFIKKEIAVKLLRELLERLTI